MEWWEKMLETENYTGHCHELNSVPPNSYVEALHLNVTIFGDGSFMEVIEAK